MISVLLVRSTVVMGALHLVLVVQGAPLANARARMAARPLGVLGSALLANARARMGVRRLGARICWVKLEKARVDKGFEKLRGSIWL